MPRLVHVPDIRGRDPYTGDENLTGVFIHSSNKNGFAGEFSKGKKGAISKGCLLIAPEDWVDFNKVMDGVNNFKVQVDRIKMPVATIKAKVIKDYVETVLFRC